MCLGVVPVALKVVSAFVFKVSTPTKSLYYRKQLADPMPIRRILGR
jgi:hypothetical protein